MSKLFFFAMMSLPLSLWANEIRNPLRIRCDCYIETQTGLNKNPGSAVGWGEQVCTEDRNLYFGYSCSINSHRLCARRHGQHAQAASCRAEGVDGSRPNTHVQTPAVEPVMKRTVEYCYNRYLVAAPVCGGPDRECDRFAEQIPALCARVWRSGVLACSKSKSNGELNYIPCPERESRRISID